MIELRNIRKVYGNQEILKNVNLVIREGECIVLKGESGSGKTTLLSLIAALHKPTSGTVIVDSLELSKVPDHFASDFRRENIGIIFQKYNLISHMSVAQNVALGLIPSSLSADTVAQRVENHLKRYAMQGEKDTEVQNLSGGQQQRVAIARATATHPKIILADEPTSNLDKKLSLEFIEHLKELKKEGKTILIATHDPLFFGLDFVDREIEVHYGRVM